MSSDGKENIVPAVHSPHGQLWRRNFGSKGSRKAFEKFFEIMCLRYMAGVTRWDRVRNDEIRKIAVI